MVIFLSQTNRAQLLEQNPCLSLSVERTLKNVTKNLFAPEREMAPIVFRSSLAPALLANMLGLLTLETVSLIKKIVLLDSVYGIFLFKTTFQTSFW